MQSRRPARKQVLGLRPESEEVRKEVLPRKSEKITQQLEIGEILILGHFLSYFFFCQFPNLVRFLFRAEGLNLFSNRPQAILRDKKQAPVKKWIDSIKGPQRSLTMRGLWGTSGGLIGPWVFLLRGFWGTCGGVARGLAGDLWGLFLARGCFLVRRMGLGKSWLQPRKLIMLKSRDLLSALLPCDQKFYITVIIFVWN